MRSIPRVLASGIGVAALIGAMSSPASAVTPFLTPLTQIKVIASTVPTNGDINPYGVAVVPMSTGHLIQGAVLVSNFNAASNSQGTGTTIVQITPKGTRSQFAQIDRAHLPGPCPGGVGLTTALAVLSSGWVVVGSLPTSDGTAATARAGCLLVLDSSGQVRETISNRFINGPWDMTAADHGSTADLFVTNVLFGTVAANGQTVNRGTVVRIRLTISASAPPAVSMPIVIGSGFAEHSDPAALVVGPTGLALAANDTLYVADTAANRISAIPHASTRSHSALTGTDVTSGGALNSPLGLALAPNGDVLSVNAGDGLIVETTPVGAQVASTVLDATGDPAGAGTLFGLAVRPNGTGVYFVDDGSNTLNLLH